MEVKLFDKNEGLSDKQKKEIVDFLHTHLEQYGDPAKDIEKALEYVVSESPTQGGFVCLSYLDTEISGAAVVLHTGMSDYIPENLLVYIATRKDLRGKGIGKLLVSNVIERAKGNIALHVEPNNPARHLYQKIGFENKYLEMRLIKTT